MLLFFLFIHPYIIYIFIFLIILISRYRTKYVLTVICELIIF